MNARIFLLPEESADAFPPTVAQHHGHGCNALSDRKTNPVSVVDYTVHTRPEFLADDELDSFILHCGENVCRAHEKGLQDESRAWWKAECHAITERGSRVSQ